MAPAFPPPTKAPRGAAVPAVAVADVTRPPAHLRDTPAGHHSQQQDEGDACPPLLHRHRCADPRAAIGDIPPLCTRVQPRLPREITRGTFWDVDNPMATVRHCGSWARRRVQAAALRAWKDGFTCHNQLCTTTKKSGSGHRAGKQ
eukprot:gene26885-55392_t